METVLHVFNHSEVQSAEITQRDVNRSLKPTGDAFLEVILKLLKMYFTRMLQSFFEKKNYNNVNLTSSPRV